MTTPHGESAAARVLLIEDNAPQRLVYEQVLDHANLDVDAVGTLREARLFLSQRGPYSAVLGDLWLPDGRALDLIDELRRDDPDVPLVLLTASPTVETAIGAIEAGVHRYLTKPITNERLIHEVIEATNLCRVARMRRKVLGTLEDRARRRRLATGKPRSQLDEAFEQMWLAAQPIVRISTRQVYAYELLVRSDTENMRTAPQILDACERQHRLGELGRRVRGLARERLTSLPGPTRIFVNLHPAEILDPDLRGDDDPLANVAERVTLEVTERARLDGVPGVDQAVRDLRATGYHIALDDLGCGYAGLTSLANLEPQVVKLDMSLVRGIDTDSMRATLVRAMIELCATLKIIVVAEGVETKAERDTLIGLGCDLLQGYYFARPGRDFPTIDPALFE
jgi:EAL domain-containing protein (putative c-di-GMP-specific phosphodiesterase class I)